MGTMASWAFTSLILSAALAFATFAAYQLLWQEYPELQKASVPAIIQTHASTYTHAQGSTHRRDTHTDAHGSTHTGTHQLRTSKTQHTRVHTCTQVHNYAQVFAHMHARKHGLELSIPRHFCRFIAPLAATISFRLHTYVGEL